MNTPTTLELEAVLDPLLDKMKQEFPSHYVTIKRFRYSEGQTFWSAGTGAFIGDGDGDTPQGAVDALIAAHRKKLPDRKAELERQLADVQAELVALEKGTT